MHYFSRLLVSVALLISVASVSVAQSLESKFHVIDQMAFYETTSIQETDLWCWAASIQMVLNTQGVEWTQKDIVKATKGSIRFETATENEITYFLNGWGFDYDGEPWESSATHYRGPMPFEDLIEEIDNDRPVIATYKTGPTSGHAVVIYAVLVSRGRVHSIYLFDPLSGEKEAISPRAFRMRTTNTWAVEVVNDEI